MTYLKSMVLVVDIVFIGSIYLIEWVITPVSVVLLVIYPANTKHCYDITDVGSTSKTLGRRCVNVINMFCICWVYMLNLTCLIDD